MWKFLKEVREELRHVVWPGKEEIRSSTIVVLLTVIVISVFLYSTDYVFEKVFEFFVSLGAG
ncbi:MAG: preprotein translocase subunit SecE [Leptonema sp. (in: Bacteria)]|nr:preprotein translocase subunit SecE [Leptonema sp. (in: bacteria)]